jgi:tetratricopeptide (TPR) repeat protein
MRSANREAARCFEQALDALGRLPATPDRVAESIDIRFDLRTALVPLVEWGRMGRLLDEAETLAGAIADQPRLARALNHKVVQFVLAGDLTAALRAGQRALEIGESQRHVGIRVVANTYLAMVHRVRGQYREAVPHSEAGIALIAEDLTHERFGQATIQGCFGRNQLAHALGALGRFAEAFERLREAVHIAEAAGHVYSLLGPLFQLGALKLDQGDFAGALAPLDRGLDLCRTREAPLPLPDFAWALGAAYHATGRRAEGVALMEDAARAIAERNVLWSWWPTRVAALGGAYVLDGRLLDASRIAQDGLMAAQQCGEQGAEAHLLMLLGDIAAHPDHGEADTAKKHYRRAQGLAEALGMRPLVAHCHLGLGKLYHRTDKREQAREHLATAATMYREMGMTYWLEKAEAELTDLGR